MCECVCVYQMPPGVKWFWPAYNRISHVVTRAGVCVVSAVVVVVVLKVFVAIISGEIYVQSCCYCFAVAIEIALSV